MDILTVHGLRLFLIKSNYLCRAPGKTAVGSIYNALVSRMFLMVFGVFLLQLTQAAQFLF